MKGRIKLSILFEHLPLSLMVGIIGALLFNNWYCLLAALISGWLIDGDHLFDFTYYAIQQYPNIDYSLIRGGGYFKQNNKIFVLLHSWEITGILLITCIVCSSSVLMIAAIAHAVHLIQDQRVYRIRRFGYSFISRAKSRFALNEFCRDAHEI